MSGHSKWSQIKRQKTVTDKKRGNVFTKLANTITIVARQGGTDPEMNFKLRLAIDKARAGNMPSDNIERAIQRGSGEAGGQSLEEVIYEGYGAEGVAIIIEAATDSKNRTTAVIRNILNKHQGRLGNSGRVTWMFDKKGVIRILKSTVADSQGLELQAIDAGAEDLAVEVEGITILTAVNDLVKVKSALEKAGQQIEMAEIEMVPKNKVQISPGSQASLSKLFEELEECEEVSNYFNNAEI